METSMRDIYLLLPDCPLLGDLSYSLGTALTRILGSWVNLQPSSHTSQALFLLTLLLI